MVSDCQRPATLSEIRAHLEKFQSRMEEHIQGFRDELQEIKAIYAQRRLSRCQTSPDPYSPQTNAVIDSNKVEAEPQTTIVVESKAVESADHQTLTYRVTLSSSILGSFDEPSFVSRSVRIYSSPLFGDATVELIQLVRGRANGELMHPPHPPPMPPPKNWESSVELLKEKVVKHHQEDSKLEVLEMTVQPHRLKLKALHWDEVRANSKTLKACAQFKSCSFQLTEQFIKSSFMENSTLRQNNQALDLRNAQTIVILLKVLKVSADGVCGALLEGNIEALEICSNGPTFPLIVANSELGESCEILPISRMQGINGRAAQVAVTGIRPIVSKLRDEGSIYKQIQEFVSYSLPILAWRVTARTCEYSQGLNISVEPIIISTRVGFLAFNTVLDWSCRANDRGANYGSDSELMHDYIIKRHMYWCIGLVQSHKASREASILVHRADADQKGGIYSVMLLLGTKESSLVWPYWDADPGFGYLLFKKMLDHLESVLSNEPISVNSGQFIVEVKPQGVSKGLVVEQIVTSVDAKNERSNFVLCNDNLENEFVMTSVIVDECPCLAMDTGFPGIVSHLNRSSGISPLIAKNIKAYMVQKLGIPEEKANELSFLLYKHYIKTSARPNAISFHPYGRTLFCGLFDSFTVYSAAKINKSDEFFKGISEPFSATTYPNAFDVRKRHELEFLNIFVDGGTTNTKVILSVCNPATRVAAELLSFVLVGKKTSIQKAKFNSTPTVGEMCGQPVITEILICVHNQKYELQDINLIYSAVIVLFSQPRPPEVTNLEDKIFERREICCRVLCGSKLVEKGIQGINREFNVLKLCCIRVCRLVQASLSFGPGLSSQSRVVKLL